MAAVGYRAWLRSVSESGEDTMQVSVTSAEGLKRTLKVVIGQGELGERFTTRLGEVKDTIQIKGFRRGKVPAAHIRKMYGRSLMAEVLQKAVEETTEKVITSLSCHLPR